MYEAINDQQEKLSELIGLTENRLAQTSPIPGIDYRKRSISIPFLPYIKTSGHFRKRPSINLGYEKDKVERYRPSSDDIAGLITYLGRVGALRFAFMSIDYGELRTNVALRSYQDAELRDRRMVVLDEDIIYELKARTLNANNTVGNFFSFAYSIERGLFIGQEASKDGSKVNYHKVEDSQKEGAIASRLVCLLQSDT